MPASIVRFCSSAKASAVIAMMGTVFASARDSARMALVASMPFITGILTSIKIASMPFDVRELVSELESITRSQAVGHGLDFEVRFKDLPEPCLMGDKLRLTQVYLNLLNNAVKYTDAGGVTLACVVADTGIGMSPEFQKTMYDSFPRVADSRIDNIQGTGLGLAIVKRMVDLIDGTIDCASTEGSGTTFTVRIPLTAVPVSTSVQEEHKEERQELRSDLTDVNVLIAEDNDVNWEIIPEMLDGYGIRCERAENGRVCVDKLTATYDLVLMDIQMPVLRGRFR